MTARNSTSLAQTDIWVDQRGIEHHLDDMSVRYKTNVLRFIERNALRIVVNAMVNAALSRRSGTTPCVECEHFGITKPHQWEHGVWHGNGPFPGSEVDNMLQDEAPVFPEVSAERAVAIVRETALAQRLIDDIVNDRGGADD